MGDSRTTDEPQLPEEWRRDRGYSYERLSELLKIKGGAAPTRRFVLGIRAPDPELLERFRELSGGHLTAESFQRARLIWQRSRKGKVKAARAAPAGTV